MEVKIKVALELEAQKLEPSDMATAFRIGANWMNQRSYTENEVKDLVIKTVSTFSPFFEESFKKKIAEEFFEINKKFLAQ